MSEITRLSQTDATLEATRTRVHLKISKLITTYNSQNM